MGVGGTFDVLAGRVSRAPSWMQHNRLEWLYRLCKEPSRFRRMLAWVALLAAWQSSAGALEQAGDFVNKPFIIYDGYVFIFGSIVLAVLQASSSMYT